MAFALKGTNQTQKIFACLVGIGGKNDLKNVKIARHRAVETLACLGLVARTHPNIWSGHGQDTP